MESKAGAKLSCWHSCPTFCQGNTSDTRTIHSISLISGTL